jgi:hypothetical protein
VQGSHKAQCTTNLLRQEFLAASGSVREAALWRNSAEASTFFTNKEVQYNADCLSSTCSEQEFLQFPWDHGGSILLHRLGASQISRRGECQGLAMDGPSHGPGP